MSGIPLRAVAYMRRALGLVLLCITTILAACGGDVGVGGGGATMPMLSAQSRATSVSDGQGASFSVTASGTAPMTYQWQRNGTNISGANAATYSIPAVTLADNGARFAVVVTNVAGSVTSTAATLTVNAVAPAIAPAGQPANVTVNDGQAATFSVVASGSAPLSYQWQRNGTNISGATAAAYAIAASLSDNGAQFTAVVTNVAGSVTSSTATLGVNAIPPTITAPPQAAFVSDGRPAMFSAVAVGSSPLAYQWQKNGTIISGANAASYMTPNLVLSDSGSSYSVVVTNSGGSITSNPVTVTVNAVIPTITTQPTSQTVNDGAKATFTVVASGGSSTLHYQWKKNGSTLVGTDSPLYTTPALNVSDSGSQYSVVVNNTAQGGGAVSSTSATLTVNSGSSQNEVVAENSLPGTSAWGLTSPATGREIEGYASATSVNRGDTIALYVNTAAASFTLEVFRTGWYQGLGARRVYGPVSLPGQVQAIPSPDPTTLLVDCNWIESYGLQTRDAATSTPWPTGVYLARLTESAGGRQAYIIFVVRDDGLRPDILFQLPVTTYQAYNYWGSVSLYGSYTGTRAYKVSFNRPYALFPHTIGEANVGNGAGEYLTTEAARPGWDYNMVRWLEQQGYNVAYSTNIDTHVSAAAVRNTSVFMSHGHDEYWSWAMRANVQAARDAGVNLAFFSGNTLYWQIRMEASPATGAANRVIVCYKSTTLDPYYTDSDPTNNKYVTTLWRAAPVSLPEEGLIGSQYIICCFDGDLIVSNGSHWVFAGTGVANGDHITGLLGYEMDGRFGNEPANTVTLTSTPIPLARRDSQMTIYSAASGAQVFGTGSIQWSWGLDDFNAPALRTSRLSQTAITVTHNVLSVFGAQPSTP